MRRYITRIVRNSKIPHAFILSLGTRDDALYFARALLCSSPAGGEPCGVCRACRQTAGGANPDLIFIAPEKNKKSLGVDDARQKINNIVSIKPYFYKYKIFVIENADTLTVQAQNALLRVLEEPPSYGVFLLLAENYSAFLPTILSRCVLLKNPPPPLAPCDLATVELILGLRSARQVFELAKDRADSAKNFLAAAAVWFRDALVYAVSRDERLIVNRDKILLLKSMNYSREYLIGVLEEITMALFSIERNANAELALDVALLRVIGR